nr:hypothetical protein [Tanacetum cinerariifolium]
MRIFTTAGYRCYDQTGSVYDNFDTWTDLKGLFTFSEKNKLTVIGCDDYALITGSNYSSGCFGLCSESSDVVEGECLGKGCCQTSITKGLTYYDVTLNTFNQHINVSDFNECGYAFLSEEGSFRFSGAKDLSATYKDFYNRVRSSVLVVLDWVIAGNCSNQASECNGKSHCYDVDSGGYRCRCNQGYEGNPYLDQGCQDIDECKDPEKYACHGICINTPGNYTCKCKKGYSGDAKIQGGCQRKPFQTLLFSLGIGLSLLTILIGLTLLYIMAKKRKLAEPQEYLIQRVESSVLVVVDWVIGRDRNCSQSTECKENSECHDADGGGYHCCCNQGYEGNPYLDQGCQELEKATDQYNENRILGRGGQGTVYKGMLADGTIVAIKKSLLVDESQIESFINEAFLLSQISHRNVVKLLGSNFSELLPSISKSFSVTYFPNSILPCTLQQPSKDPLTTASGCIGIESTKFLASSDQQNMPNNDLTSPYSLLIM